MPLITRRSSTRGLPGLPCGRWGSNAAQASSDNQNKCVIAASSSVRLNEGRDSPKYSTCCMSSQPRLGTHSKPLTHDGGECEPREVVLGVAIVSGCDASPVFQLAEHALDDIAAPIDLLIERVWGPSGGG